MWEKPKEANVISLGTFFSKEDATTDTYSTTVTVKQRRIICYCHHLPPNNRNNLCASELPRER